jgi:large subunit ribosomal protein L25
MSTEDFILNAEKREEQGKGASRRLRHAGKFPGIVYGGGKNPMPITLDHNEAQRHLEHEAFYSHILTLKIGNDSEQVILRDVQRHPAKPFIQHMDLQRVKANEAIRMHVPLHLVGEDTAPGVKLEGGVFMHNAVDVEIECLPGDLPEYIEVDVSGLHVGGAIHLSEIKLPKGVKLVAMLNASELSAEELHAIDQPVASIQHKTTREEPSEAAPAAAEEPKPASEE